MTDVPISPILLHRMNLRSCGNEAAFTYASVKDRNHSNSFAKYIDTVVQIYKNKICRSADQWLHMHYHYYQIILNVVNKYPLYFNVSSAKNLCVAKRQFSRLCHKVTKADSNQRKY
jgi:hypothetical protein